MSTNTFQLTLTEKAATELVSLIKDAAEGSFLRVRATNGCSGLTYDMSLANSKEYGDTVIENMGVTIVIDSESVQYLDGSTIEYEDNSLLSGFSINNPSFKQNCCSSSPQDEEHQQSEEQSCQSCRCN